MAGTIPGAGIAITHTVVTALGCPAGYVRQSVGGKIVCVPAPKIFNLSEFFSQNKEVVLIGGSLLAVLLFSKRK
jgi:hypothetical protein